MALPPQRRQETETMFRVYILTGPTGPARMPVADRALAYALAAEIGLTKSTADVVHCPPRAIAWDDLPSGTRSARSHRLGLDAAARLAAVNDYIAARMSTHTSA